MASANTDSISVTVNGRTYSCGENGGGSSDNCDTAVNSFRNSLKNCLENYNGSYERTSKCVPQTWPNFKKYNPDQCIYIGQNVCNELCIQYYNGSYERTSKCAEQCN